MSIYTKVIACTQIFLPLKNLQKKLVRTLRFIDYFICYLAMPFPLHVIEHVRREFSPSQLAIMRLHLVYGFFFESLDPGRKIFPSSWPTHNAEVCSRVALSR
jgi:hypothetical protein